MKNRIKAALLAVALAFGVVSTAIAALTPGVYVIGGAYVLDAGFNTRFWNSQTVAYPYQNTSGNQYQQFTLSPSGSGFTVCNVTDPGHCLADGGANVSIGAATDVWTVVASGSNWTLQSQRTGNYVGAIPQVNGGVPVPMSSTPVSIPMIQISGALSFQLVCPNFPAGHTCTY